MTADINASTAPLDHRLELAQTTYLERCALGYQTRRVRWSGGLTQVIELSEGLALGAPAGIRCKVPLQMRLGTLPILKTLVRSMMMEPTRDSTLAFWSQLMVAHPERLDVDLLDALTASQARNAPSWFSLIDSTIDVRGMKPELMVGERWKKLSVPTTLILGKNDAWCPPEEGEAIALSNPHVQVVRIPAAGHAAWLDDPGNVVDVINETLTEF